jgi:hypothetical protein
MGQNNNSSCVDPTSVLRCNQNTVKHFIEETGYCVGMKHLLLLVSSRDLTCLWGWSGTSSAYTLMWLWLFQFCAWNATWSFFLQVDFFFLHKYKMCPMAIDRMHIGKIIWYMNLQTVRNQKCSTSTLAMEMPVWYTWVCNSDVTRWWLKRLFLLYVERICVIEMKFKLMQRQVWSPIQFNFLCCQ